jgi:hypothetical protein
MNQSDFNIREVTKGAFTQARKKLNPECFKRLNNRAVEAFYKYNEVYTWYGHRLLAVDGARLMLPNHKTVREEFGVYGFGSNADSERSLTLCSMLYDVMNLLTADSEIAPYSSNERSLFYHHLEYTMEDDLILMDRGYPSIGLFFLLQAKGLHFCARMKESWWKEVDRFVKSGKKEAIVTFRLPVKDHKLLKDYPKWHDKELRCRLVKVELPNGEYEILCTSARACAILNIFLHTCNRTTPNANPGLPGTIWRFPRTSGGFPEALGGFPDVLGGFPDALGGLPDALGETPQKQY